MLSFQRHEHICGTSRHLWDIVSGGLSRQPGSHYVTRNKGNGTTHMKVPVPLPYSTLEIRRDSVVN